MALPGGQCCPWRWAALLAAVTCLLPGALLGAALGAAAAWWALRGRPPARRPLPPRSPARLLPPERSPPLRLPPRGPGPSLAARFPSPGQRAPWPLPRERAGTNGSAATATGPGVSAPSRGNCPGDGCWEQGSWCVTRPCQPASLPSSCRPRGKMASAVAQPQAPSVRRAPVPPLRPLVSSGGGWDGTCLPLTAL
ncbi:uncharacterized protein LOC136022127 [Lathamus discolor]|uniref:uncharacterized protein LOC136022127 n=1 Tax=Lathamus discolor TaxID=678569 RepID=UPI0032B86236